MYNQEEKGDKRSRRSYKKKQWREKSNTRFLIYINLYGKVKSNTYLCTMDNEREILSKLDAIIQNQKVLYENQIVIFQTLASIGQKVYSQSDFKSLMINMVANGITERVEANDQQRRNI